MNVYAAVTIVALSTALGMFLADRIYVLCRWWRALAAAERAEQQQPDAGLSMLNARRTPSSRRKRRKSFADHADEALDVFNTEEQDAHDELLVAVQELQQTDPADLWSVYNREASQ